MADLKTSQEVVASPLDGTELVRITQGGSTVRTTAAAIAALASALGIHGAPLKATPVDADELPLADSATGYTSAKFTWANLKAAVWASLGTLIGAGTSKATPVDADRFALMDSAASNATKALTWANAKATLKTYFDTLYAAGTGSVTNSAGALTAHALILGNGGADEKALASLGTVNKVLHGNAAGDPTWGAVDLTADVTGVLPTGNLPVNVANGIAPLDSGGKVPAANLPSYVDDVLEFANLAAFPGTGETGKVYVALDTNATYRWTGSTYVQLVASPGTTDNVPEGSTNLYFTSARIASGIHAATGKATPVDADELGIADSAASYALKKVTFANLKAWVWAALGPLIAAGTSKATPVDADLLAIADSAASNATKYLSLTNFKAYLKTYFDTLYAAAFTGGTLSSALNEAPPVTIASSATPAIFAAAGNTINLTGTVTVTGFDSIAAGAVRRVIFGGILQLTYNATSMQNLTSANITTAAGDVAEFESLGSGNTKMLAYTRKDGTALVGGSGGSTQGLQQIPLSAGAWYSDDDLPPEWSRMNGASGFPSLSGWNMINTSKTSIYTVMRMPKKWNAGTVTFSVDWKAPATDTGNVVFSLRACAYSDQDSLTGTGFGTAQTSTDAGTGTANQLMRSPVSSAITIAGSPQKEDFVVFEFSRETTGNTFGNYALVVNVTINITTDADTDA